MREQAARAEAERVAELVSGMQLLVDAALAHRTLDDILFDLVARVRAVLDADAATIYLAEDSTLVLAAASGGADAAQTAEPVPFGEGFAGRVAAEREPMLVQDPPPAELPYPALEALEIDSLIGLPLLAEGEVTGVLVVGARRAAPLLRRRREPAAPGGRPGRARHRPRARVRARAQDRRDAAAQPAAGPPAAAARACRWPPATCPPPPRPRSAATGTTCSRPRAAAVGLVMGDVAGKGLAAASMVGRLRSALRAYALEGHAAGARGGAAQPTGLDRGGRQPDGHPPVRGRRPRGRADPLG